MFDSSHPHECASQPAAWTSESFAAGFDVAWLRAFEPRRRVVKAKAQVFRAGQAAGSVFLINSGVFKTSIASADGREKITGFRMRGDLLGLCSLGMHEHAGDAVALTVGEVWEYSQQQLFAAGAAAQQRLATVLASEIRRDWEWMLSTSSFGAEQRVVSFLLDLSARMQARGYSGRELSLPMSRSELGNYLALQLETVVRALSKLQQLGLIAIDGRDISLRDSAGLRALLTRPTQACLRAA